ncbi:hypothetical protein [Microbulbifer agarilyticus]|uniref:hypothetical protein n=1 Tax=Microbulbifer agarilyticus TaxID=260552 RepID=UPI001CD575B0|nr:hypothetical protein [Microbulbifer agarilyticus]MCA0895124.1 hypothetical protein [Microbulbifer agarilyticus]
MKFEISEEDQEVDVKITAPSSVEGFDFNFATLVKGNVEKLDFDFMFFPSVNNSGDHIIIQYMVKRSLFADNILQLKYGPGCGKILEYPVAT